MILKNRGNTCFVARNPYFEHLRRASLFSHLDDETLKGLLRKMSVKRWHGGAIIVGENEPGEAFYLLVSGRAQVVLFGENGREMTLAVLQPGDSFGERSLLAQKPRTTNVLAMEDCVILVLERTAFCEHLKQHPDTMLRMLNAMAERSRRADELIGSLALQDVASRLARKLVDLAGQCGEAAPGGILIKKRPTQQDLANMVGTCRETVSRTLSAMARQGLVVSRGRSLLLTQALVEGARQAA